MIKYYAKSTYVDIETGEIISKKLAERDYVILKTSKIYHKQLIRDTNGKDFGNITIEHIRECERNRQLKLY